MATIKHVLFNGWHFVRWLRLVFAILFATEAVRNNDILMGLAAAFFLFMAIFNTPCGGSAACASPDRKSIEKKME